MDIELAMERNIFITGKTLGLGIEQCRKKFSDVENSLKLERSFDAVVSPYSLAIPLTWKRDQQKEMRMEVLKRRCNCLFLLKDYKEDSIAVEEYNYAFNHNYEIFFEDHSHSYEHSRLYKAKIANQRKAELV